MDEFGISTELGDRRPKRLKKEIESCGNKKPSENKKQSEEDDFVGRKWEDLPINCLVDVFSRLSLDDLTLGIPFVCKSWYEASLDPTCWRTLDFRAIDPWAGSQFTEKFKHAYRVEKFTFRGFLKFIVTRSHKLATGLVLPKTHFPLRDLVYICKECPALNIFTSWEGGLHCETPIRGLVLKMTEAILKFHCNL